MYMILFTANSYEKNNYCKFYCDASLQIIKSSKLKHFNELRVDIYMDTIITIGVLVTQIPKNW